MLPNQGTISPCAFRGRKIRRGGFGLAVFAGAVLSVATGPAWAEQTGAAPADWSPPSRAGRLWQEKLVVPPRRPSFAWSRASNQGVAPCVDDIFGPCRLQ